MRDFLAELAAEVRLVTRYGFGTIVGGPLRKALMRLSGFTEDIQVCGQVARSCVTGRLIGSVSPDIAFRTGLPLGTDVMSRSRQGQPMMKGSVLNAPRFHPWGLGQIWTEQDPFMNGLRKKACA